LVLHNYFDSSTKLLFCIQLKFEIFQQIRVDLLYLMNKYKFVKT